MDTPISFLIKSLIVSILSSSRITLKLLIDSLILSSVDSNNFLVYAESSLRIKFSFFNSFKVTIFFLASGELLLTTQTK